MDCSFKESSGSNLRTFSSDFLRSVFDYVNDGSESVGYFGLCHDPLQTQVLTAVNSLNV